MRTITATLAGVLVLGLASVASGEPLATTGDPTGGQFSGDYQCGWEQTRTKLANGTYTEWKYTKNSDGTYKKVMCRQTGGISVYSDGVEACNGNPNHQRPDDKSPLVGYIWVGPGRKASTVTAASPGNVVGAGHNNGDDGSPSGQAPCNSGGSAPPPNTDTKRTVTTNP